MNGVGINKSYKKVDPKLHFPYHDGKCFEVLANILNEYELVASRKYIISKLNKFYNVLYDLRYVSSKIGYNNVLHINDLILKENKADILVSKFLKIDVKPISNEGIYKYYDNVGKMLQDSVTACLCATKRSFDKYYHYCMNKSASKKNENIIIYEIK